MKPERLLIDPNRLVKAAGAYGLVSDLLEYRCGIGLCSIQKAHEKGHLRCKLVRPPQPLTLFFKAANLMAAITHAVGKEQGAVGDVGHHVVATYESYDGVEILLRTAQLTEQRQSRTTVGTFWGTNSRRQRISRSGGAGRSHGIVRAHARRARPPAVAPRSARRWRSLRAATNRRPPCASRRAVVRGCSIEQFFCGCLRPLCRRLCRVRQISGIRVPNAIRCMREQRKAHPPRLP